MPQNAGDNSPPGTSTPVPAPRLLARQRDPPIFNGSDNMDIDEWLVHFHRAASHNNWDDDIRLSNVVFYLSGTALRWFENNETLMTTWTSFKENIIKTFRKGDDRKQQASRILALRRQIPGETFQCYMEDVLSLCRKVDPQMHEYARVGHLLKGLSESLFNAVAAQDHTTVDALASACRRVEDLRRSRIVSSLANTDAIQTGSEEHALGSLIRQIVREELALLHKPSQPVASTDHLTFGTNSCSWAPPAPETSLRQLVQDEIARTTATEINSRTYAAVCATPAPATPPVTSCDPAYTVAPVLTQPLPRYRRPPTCYYCGFLGHISRFCRRRQADRQRQRPWIPYDTDGRRYSQQFQSDSQQRRDNYLDPQGYANAQFSGQDSLGRRSRSPSPAGRRRSVSPMRPAGTRAVPVN